MTSHHFTATLIPHKHPQIRDLIDGKNANIVANPIVAAAREVADRHGLVLHAEATGRSAGKITFTMTLTVPGRENEAPADFIEAARRLGLDASLYRRQFRAGRRRVFTIVALHPNRPKNCIEGEGARGGKYIFPREAVLPNLI